MGNRSRFQKGSGCKLRLKSRWWVNFPGFLELVLAEREARIKAGQDALVLHRCDECNSDDKRKYKEMGLTVGSDGHVYATFTLQCQEPSQMFCSDLIGEDE